MTAPVCTDGRMEGTATSQRCPRAAGCPVLKEGPAGQPKEACGVAQEMVRKALVSALGAIGADSKLRAAKKLAEVGGVSEIEALAGACWGREEMVAELRRLVERHGEEGARELGRIARETNGKGAYWPILSVARAASAVKSQMAVDVLDAVAERAAQNGIYGEPPKTGLWKDVDDFVKMERDLRDNLYDAILTAIEELGVPACSARVIGKIIDSPDSLSYGIKERAIALLS